MNGNHISPVYRDRKRKRFVGGETEANKKKKIKTESGHWIDATYKSGMYPFCVVINISTILVL